MTVGQSGAIRHGASSVPFCEPDFRDSRTRDFYRDARKVERKKPGLKKLVKHRSSQNVNQ